MPGKSAGLDNKPQSAKATSGSRRPGSSINKSPGQRPMRIPVVGGGKRVNKPRRRMPRKTTIPGCLLPITGVVLLALLLIVLTFMA
jgi:hypothetical protein